MALADILLDVEYVPFILYMSFPHLISLDNSWEKNSWGWSAYMIFHAHFSVIIHNVSIWLTLSVAIWRFIMIRFHHLVPVYCTVRRCHILLFSAYGMFENIWNVELKPFDNKNRYSSVFTVKKEYISIERIHLKTFGVSKLDMRNMFNTEHWISHHWNRRRDYSLDPLKSWNFWNEKFSTFSKEKISKYSVLL